MINFGPTFNLRASLNFGPIFRALGHRKFGAVLLATQIALATAILSISVFVATELDRSYQLNSGVDDAQLFTLMLRTAEGYINYPIAERDLEIINKFPDVESSAILRWMPYAKNALQGELRTDQDRNSYKVKAAITDVSTTTLSTLGLKIIAGRNFSENEMLIEAEAGARNNVKIIITSVLAKQLFQTDTLALGKQIYDRESSYEIIGVTQDWLGFGIFPNQTHEPTIFLPHYWEKDSEQRYLIRTRTAEARQATINVLMQTLKILHHNQVLIYSESFDTTKHHASLHDHKISALLKVLNILLGLAVAFAISGQTLFGVSQRTKQIAVRRALGATRQQIILWLIIENCITCTIGLLIGIFLSFLANQKISDLGYPNMPIIYLVQACAMLLTLCIVCTLIPAWQAARIPPSIATKTS